MNRNRSRGPQLEETRSQATSRTPVSQRGSCDLEEDTSVTSPSHHPDEDEDHPSSCTPPQPAEHSDTASHSRTSANQRQGLQRRRNSDEAACGSSGQIPHSQLREKSHSVQDMKSLQVYRHHYSPIEELSSERTPEYIGPQEAGWRRRNWESAATEHHLHQRSQSADSNPLCQSTTMPHSTTTATISHSSQAPPTHSSQRRPSTEVEDSAANPPRSENPWSTLHPQAYWNDGFGYDTVESSQHSPTAAPDTAFWAEQPPPTNSRLNFMSELSQNRQSQSPTEHLRRLTVDHQDIAIHVDSTEFRFSGNSCSPRDNTGFPQSVPLPYVYLSQQDEWVGTTMPPPQQRKRDGGHASQPHKTGNLSRMASEPYLGPPGLKSSVAAALAQEIPPPPLTQYSDTQSQELNRYQDSPFVDGRGRHAASQMSAGVPAGRKQYRRAKAYHHRSQERL